MNVIEQNINWWEISKYIAVFYSTSEIEKEGLRNVLPRRQCKATRPLTINCLNNTSAKKDDEKWIAATS